MNRKKIVFLLVLALSVIGLFLYRNMTATDANKRLSQEITEKIEKEEKENPKKSSGNGEEKEKEKENKEEADFYKKKLSEAQKINEEAVAWLTLPGTFIDYPVTQAENNDYYLDHNIYKKKDPVGSIYLDYENDLKKDNSNLILYGHSLATDNMFSDLLKYKDQKFFDDHSKIYLYGNGTLEEYTAVAGFVMDMAKKDQIFHFNEFIDGDDQMNSKDYVEEAKNRSLVRKDIDVGEKDKLITLSTCSYEYNDARFVLVGVKK
ncbi:MAG: class B sortase [Gallicola sp.]|nr:class B sortase [Gallicola sp.]